VRVHLKVVPGASRDEVVGPHGDRVRVRVRAPAESGRANRAVQELLARTLGLPVGAVALVRGETTPLKTFEVVGLGPEAVGRLLYGGGR
jgi:uncharacterized protein (TIGR00251 family)